MSAFPFYCAGGDPSVGAEDAGGTIAEPPLLSETGEEVPTTLVATNRPRGTSPPEVRHELRLAEPLAPGAYRLEFSDRAGQPAVRRFRAIAASPARADADDARLERAVRARRERLRARGARPPARGKRPSLDSAPEVL